MGFKKSALLCQGIDAELAIGMHLLAGGLVWLVPQSNQDHIRSELFDCLRSRLPEAFLPDAPVSLSNAYEVGSLSSEQNMYMLCVVILSIVSALNCLQFCITGC